MYEEPKGAAAPYRLVSPRDLARLQASEPAPLILDVRRRLAFAEKPLAIPDAIPLVLDNEPLEIPNVQRERLLVLYCLCRAESSSSRAAGWLSHRGYRNLALLEGGLSAWESAGLPLTAIEMEERRDSIAWKPYPLDDIESIGAPRSAPGDNPFLSRLEEGRILRGRKLPLRRNITVVFVDMVDSTRLFSSLPAERVLRMVQIFMEIVSDVGALHCGDVHDFEGDGAMLYFQGVGEALPAAFEIRRRLEARRQETQHLLRARISLDEGPLVIGVVGSRFRKGVALVGPCVSRGARILKLSPPGGIVATENVIRLGHESNPDLARRFISLGEAPPLKGLEDESVQLFLAEPD